MRGVEDVKRFLFSLPVGSMVDGGLELSLRVPLVESGVHDASDGGDGHGSNAARRTSSRSPSSVVRRAAEDPLCEGMNR